MFCRKCGKEILDEAVVCVHCGCSTQQVRRETETSYDSPSTGMAVVGFLIPLVGLIIWLINQDTKPQKAKSAGTGALIGFIVSVVFYSLAAML